MARAGHHTPKPHVHFQTANPIAVLADRCATSHSDSWPIQTMSRARRPRGLSANYADEQERLQEILNDKSTLVVRLLARENWVKFDCRSSCFYCDRKFRPFMLKRHCRACGEVVCTSCYRRRKVQTTLDAPVATVPLCFDCIDKAMISADKEGGRARDDSVLATQGRLKSDSVKTASTGESFCSRFSEFSGAGGNDHEPKHDDISDTESEPTLRYSRKMNGQEIEFLPEKEQFDIYESRRREILEQYGVTNPGCEKEYEALCELASRALDSTVAAVAFIDDKRQWYKARIGISQSELPREVAFCSQMLQTPLPSVILDVSKDPRFAQNPLVTGSAHIRFYATSPICDPESGIILGSVFVMDPKPKQKMPPRAVEMLSYVTTAAERLLTDQARRSQDSMKVKRHSSPSISLRSSGGPRASELRPGSLMSVPEEIDGEDFHLALSSSRSSTSSSRSSRSTRSDSARRRSSQPQYQLFDPKTVLSSSTGNLKDKSTRKSGAPRRNTDAGVVPTALDGRQPQATDLTRRDVGPPAPADGMQSLDKSCFELFYRITTTQQMLVQQQSALLTTLNQHASRIGSIEKTVDRIEGMVLSIQREQKPANEFAM